MLLCMLKEATYLVVHPLDHKSENLSSSVNSAVDYVIPKAVISFP